MQGLYKYRYNSDCSMKHSPALKNGPEIATDQVNDTKSHKSQDDGADKVPSGQAGFRNMVLNRGSPIF